MIARRVGKREVETAANAVHRGGPASPAADCLTLRVLVCCLALGTLFRPGEALAQNAKGEPADEVVEPETPDEPSVEEQKELPTLDLMELPTLARLLAGPAVDWIVLRNKKVIEVEPVYPRPGALEALEKRIKASLTGPVRGKTAEATKTARRNLYYLPVTLLDGEEREFKLHQRYIGEIVYYDDLILRRIDALLDERQTAGAFELLSLLAERQKEWPGVAPRKERLLLIDAALKCSAGDLEPALAILEELHRRNPAVAGFNAELGRVGEQLLNAAVTAEDYRRARHFLQRMKRMEPRHAIAQKWSTRLQELASTALVQADAAQQTRQFSKALDHAEQSARIWPDLPELSAAYGRHSRRFQRLTVAVWDLPAGSSSGAIPTASDQRRLTLTQTHLFRPLRFEDKLVRYEAPLFEEWEPTELGHSLRIRLRTYRAAGAGGAAVSATSVVALLAPRLDPGHPAYDERLASSIESVAVPSPGELIFRLRQVPLRPEAVFAFLPPLPDLAQAAEGESAGSPARQAVAAAFRVQELNERRVVYRRNLPEPDSLVDRHVEEIIEQKYESYEKALQGFLRGEALLMPRVAAWDVARLETHGGIFLLPYAVPVTHFLQFNPRCPTLNNRTLRRALVYALDRPQVLNDVFLRKAQGAHGKVTSAIVPSTSYAYHPAVEPHKHDLHLAASLALAARKELGGAPIVLRLLCTGDANAVAAARQIIAYWARIGVSARLIDEAGGVQDELHNPSVWDVAYREIRMLEPLVELWPALTTSGTTRVDRLAELPSWLRHELIALDGAGDWDSVETLIRRIHKQLWAEVQVIPLWELNDYLAVRKAVRGVASRPVHTYQGVEQWRLEPWYAK